MEEPKKNIREKNILAITRDVIPAAADAIALTAPTVPVYPDN